MSGVPSPSNAASNEWRQSLFENSLIGIMLANSETDEILAANPEACRLLGYTETEICKLDRTAVMDTTDLRLAPALAQGARDGRFRGELRCRRRDGTLFPVEMASSIFTSADGQALTSIFFLDISARVQTEAALQRLAAIDASTDDAIISADLAGNVMSWNQGAEKLYGYYAAEAIGRPLTALIVPEQSQNFERYIDLFRHGEPILRTEATHRHKEGYAIGVIMTISPIKNAEDQIIGVSLIARDITEYKRIQDETDRLAAIVESAQDAIVSINFDGKITSWNHSAERIYGHPAAAVMGTSLFALLAPGQTVNMQPMLDRIRQGETIPLPDLTWQTPAGHNLVLAVTLGPVKNRTGAMIGAASAPPPCRAVAIL